MSQEIMGLGPASGLCCGYTMTRAILSDAIALVRGERFAKMQASGVMSWDAISRVLTLYCCSRGPLLYHRLHT